MGEIRDSREVALWDVLRELCMLACVVMSRQKKKKYDIKKKEEDLAEGS